MEKEFVTYEIGLELKNLGFDEPCLAGYSTSTEKLEYYSRPLVTKDSFTVDAPTYSQAFRFFREKYGLRIRNYVFVNMSGGISEGFEVFRYAEDTISRVWALTYEKAELACLKNLIEIVKVK